jgi:hypothetical protein
MLVLIEWAALPSEILLDTFWFSHRVLLIATSASEACRRLFRLCVVSGFVELILPPRLH